MADESLELVPASRMRACIAGVLGALGVPGEDAAVVADALVEADLTGVDSHGIHLLTMYVERLRDVILTVAREERTEKELA